MIYAEGPAEAAPTTGKGGLRAARPKTHLTCGLHRMRPAGTLRHKQKSPRVETAGLLRDIS